MSVRRIKTYPITRLNGITKLEVPQDSVLIGAEPLFCTNEVVHVIVSEPVVPEEAEKTTLTILTINANSAYEEPDDDKVMIYIGTAAWDNGHRLSHIFEIADRVDWEAEWSDGSYELVDPPEPVAISDDVVLTEEEDEQEADTV